jgi:tetratricopeptide (TPR) repeat protein
MKKIRTGFVFILFTLGAGAQDMDLGRRQLYYERYASASKTYEAVLQQQPGNAEAIYHLTKALVLQNKASEAGTVLLGAQQGLLTEPLYKAAYGYWLLSQHKKDSAATYFTQALDATKRKDVTVLTAIAEASINNEAGDPAFAVSVINDALHRDKKNAYLYLLLGDAYVKQNNGAAVYENYNKAVQLDQNYAAAWYKLGKVFLAQKSRELYLDYFTKAVNADANYAPAIYQLYAHYFYYDPAKAYDYYNRFVAVSDPSDQREYDLADILFLNKKYPEAIAQANKIIREQQDNTNPKIYKLIAYSQAAEKDTAAALNNMQYYFSKEADSNFLAKDYELMANLYHSHPDSSSFYFMKAVNLEKDSSALPGYYKKIADIAKAEKDYKTQAEWLGKYYNSGAKTTNVDLFSWGLAHYLAGEYNMADSVFGLYSTKYPEQSFGYYWRARSNAALDTEMKDGLAVPYYQKLTEILQANPDDVNYKKWMTEAYGYLAAYTANVQNNKTEAIDYFEKVLEVDSTNESAKKYIEILEKDMAKGN